MSTDPLARRVLMLAPAFGARPDEPAAALAPWLAERGHALHVIAAAPAADAGQTDARAGRGGWWIEQQEGFAISRCPLRRARHGGALAQALEQASFALSSAPVLLERARAFRPQLIGAVAASPATLPALLAAAERAGARRWLHLAEDAALKPTGALARLMRRFDLVSLAAVDAEERLAAFGIAEEKRLPLAPWVDTRALFPLRGAGPLRRTLGIAEDAIVALYAGSLADERALATVLEAARRVPANGAIVFALCGRGPAWPRLVAAAAQLPPLRLLPWPPAADLNAILNLADLHLLPTGLALHDPLFPARLAACLASGRPILAPAPPPAAPRPLRDAVIPYAPGAGGLTDAVIRLAAAPAERLTRGLAARQAALDYHEKQRVWRRLEAALGLGAALPEALAS